MASNWRRRRGFQCGGEINRSLFDETSIRLGRQKRAFLCSAPEASRLHVAGSTTNQEAAKPPSVSGPRGVKALLVIWQENAVMAPSVSVFGL